MYLENRSKRAYFLNQQVFRLSILLFLVSAVTLPLSAQPTIKAVENAAGNIVPGLPNAGLAQGAIFVVYGSGLGPVNIVIAPSAFQSTNLSNTSVAISVGGTTVNAPIYYTSATQVAALLPSNTSTGAGTVTVSYNNQVSTQTSITVVTNNLGIFTVDSSGGGPGIVTYPDYSLVSPVKAANCGGPNTTCGSANSGDTLILWATGLGPVNGSDASGAGLGQAIDAPLTVWLGGVQAPVTYQGRSGCCIAEDQIIFTVPNNVPTGCAVPLVVQIGSQVSNTVLMPVANGSRTCTGLYTSPTNVQLLSSSSSFSFGVVELDHLYDGGGAYHDQAKFNFIKVASVPPTAQPFVATYFDNQPIGTCSVYTGSHAPGDTFINNLNLAPLDAGPSFTVQGPNGNITVMAQTGDTPILSASGAVLVPGDYTITGSGGKDVGAFTTKVSLPTSPTLISPANSNTLTVTRSQGMAVTWNANGSTGHVEIVLASSAGAATATLVCTASASAGTFTIPPYALLSLPAGNSTFFALQPGDQIPASSTQFQAAGLAAGVAQTFVDSAGLEGFPLK